MQEHHLPVRLRLLTDSQHANAIRELVGDVELPDVRTPGVVPDQFVHEAALYQVGGPLLSQYRTAARWAALHVATAPADLLPCSPADIGEEPCILELIETFASRAFRRPLTDVDRRQLLALFKLGREQSFATGVGMIVEAVLVAPDFLYRKELGGLASAHGVVTLTPHELASQLSFLFLDSIPDAPLWAAANDGSLSRPEVQREHVERLLELPRVRSHLDAVMLTWLSVAEVQRAEKDPERYPELDQQLKDSMIAETSLFVDDVLWRRGGSLHQLLTSSRSFVDARLGAIYGVDVNASGPIEVELDPGERGGVLTHASVLTPLGTELIRSIVARGLYVNRLFVCHPEPPPPTLELLESVADQIKPLSERERADFRAENGSCSGCHDAFDPLGIALEGYDAIGRVIVREAQTIVSLADGESFEVSGAVELGQVLAHSDSVARCVADQLIERAFGGQLEKSASRQQIHQRFAASNLDLVEVFRAIAGSQAFGKRSVQQ